MFPNAYNILKNQKKRTIIIQGGPGTGKSVLAINLLKDFIAEKQGDKLNISSYYDIAQTVNEPWHYKELQGSSGGNTYTLKLYDAGIGFIYNDSGKPVYCYSCSKKANDNEHIIFVQTWYCKDKRIKFSPIWFRNGQFLFDSVESIFDLDGVEQITWTQGNNFTITCKDATNDLLITFATPADFNVFEFFKDDGAETGDKTTGTSGSGNLMTLEIKALIEKDRAELLAEFCRGCGYCMPCTMEITINQCARMSQMIRRAPSQSWLTPYWQGEMLKIEKCIDCGTCLKRCPYELNIPNLLRKNLADYKEIVAGRTKV